MALYSINAIVKAESRSESRRPGSTGDDGLAASSSAPPAASAKAALPPPYRSWIGPRAAPDAPRIGPRSRLSSQPKDGPSDCQVVVIIVTITAAVVRTAFVVASASCQSSMTHASS